MQTECCLSQQAVCLNKRAAQHPIDRQSDSQTAKLRAKSAYFGRDDYILNKPCCIGKPESALNLPSARTRRLFRTVFRCFNARSLLCGEPYLFHRTDRLCPQDGSLREVPDRCDGFVIRPESGRRNLFAFDMWPTLPEGYRYFRLSSREELRDYASNPARSETQMALSKHSQTGR